LATKAKKGWIVGTEFLSEHDVHVQKGSLLSRPDYWCGASVYGVGLKETLPEQTFVLGLTGGSTIPQKWSSYEDWTERLFPKSHETYAYLPYTQHSPAFKNYDVGDVFVTSPYAAGLLISGVPQKTAPPAWLSPTLRGFARMFNVMPGTSGARERHIANALAFLVAHVPDEAAAPSLSPLNDGGIQLEWHGGGIDVEVIFSDDADERGIYVRDKATKKELELTFSDASTFAQAFSPRLVYA
jgi:hypothetical protein